MTSNDARVLTSVICAVYSQDPNRQALLEGHARNLRQQSVRVNPIYVFEAGDEPPADLPGKVLVIQTPLTIYEAWNIAIQWVDTPYVMNLNLDDRLKTNAVETLQRCLVETQSDIVCGDWEICFSQAATDRVGEVEPVSSLPASAVWPPVPGERVRMGSGTGENVTLGPATLWRHDLHSMNAVYPAYTQCGQPICAVADAIWWTLLIRFAGGKLQRCAEVVGHYHSHPKDQAEFRFPQEWDALRGKRLSSHLPATFYENLKNLPAATANQKIKQTGGWIDRIAQPENLPSIDEILSEWHTWAGLMSLADRLLPTLSQPALTIFHQGSRLSLHAALPHVEAIDVNAEVDDFQPLSAADEAYATVVVDDALARVNDYRGAVADWFRVLKPNGTLVLVVPHQFYFERKLVPPSQAEPAHRRFYTSATLLSEVEEALEPYSYQVMAHEEHVAERHDASIVLVLKKCAPPDWADAVMDWDSPQAGPNRQFAQINREHAPDMVEQLIRVLPQQQKPQRFLLLKLDHRGDFLLAKKAFELLRGAFPKAHFTLCCGSWNVSAAQQQGLFDDVFAFDYFKENPSLAETRAPDDAAELGFADQLAGLSFDVAIDFRMQGDTRHLLERVHSGLRIGVGRAHQYPFLDFNLDLNSPVYRGQAIERHVPASEFSVTALGRHDGYRVVLGHGPRGIRTRLRNALGRSLPHQMLIFGPYEDLRPGRYLIRPIIEAPSRLPPLGYDISVNRGQSTLQAGTLTQKHINEGIELDLEEAVTGYELRLYGPPDAVLQFYGAHVFKQGESGGTHSEEQMAMLALFCALRLEFPYQNAT